MEMFNQKIIKSVMFDKQCHRITDQIRKLVLFFLGNNKWSTLLSFSLEDIVWSFFLFFYNCYSDPCKTVHGKTVLGEWLHQMF